MAQRTSVDVHTLVGSDRRLSGILRFEGRSRDARVRHIRENSVRAGTHAALAPQLGMQTNATVTS